MGTRTTVVTDSFNRAALGSNWLQLDTWHGSVSIYNSTNVYSGQSQQIGDWPAARYIGTDGSEEAGQVMTGSFTDDQYSSLVISALAFQSAPYGHGVIVRASADVDSSNTSTRDYYAVAVQNSTGGPTYPTVLYKVVNGTATTLHSASVVWAVNDRLELEVEGSTLRVCKNGTALGGSFTQTDTALTTGKPGVAMAAGGSSSILGDDWEGGNITSGASAVPAIASFYQMLRSA